MGPFGSVLGETGNVASRALPIFMVPFAPLNPAVFLVESHFEMVVQRSCGRTILANHTDVMRVALLILFAENVWVFTVPSFGHVAPNRI